MAAVFVALQMVLSRVITNLRPVRPWIVDSEAPAAAKAPGVVATSYELLIEATCCGCCTAVPPSNKTGGWRGNANGDSALESSSLTDDAGPEIDFVVPYPESSVRTETIDEIVVLTDGASSVPASILLGGGWLGDAHGSADVENGVCGALPDDIRGGIDASKTMSRCSFSAGSCCFVASPVVANALERGLLLTMVKHRPVDDEAMTSSILPRPFVRVFCTPFNISPVLPSAHIVPVALVPGSRYASSCNPWGETVLILRCWRAQVAEESKLPAA